MQDTILKYIHIPQADGKIGPRVGVIVATKLTNDPSKVGIGWSVTAVKKGDRFDREKGKMIALNRANNGTNARIPHKFESELLEMRSRAVRYFKTAEVID